MVAEVWLHIGTPKSGTSSLQKYLMAHKEALAKQGLAYLVPPGKASCNDLAIAINRARQELIGLAAGLNHQIEQRPERRALISSEMFYGIKPETLIGLIPALAGRPLKVLVYLRRQDRYIEAMFLQKSKNGRFLGSIADYIDKFDGSGSDYAAMLAPWQTAGADVELIPRVLERACLTGGSVVSDAFEQMGLAPPEPSAPADVNLSPGLPRVQLLQAAAQAGIANPRRLQRSLAAMYPQKPEERSPILTQAESRAFLARFEAGNRALAERYFPDRDTLFATNDDQDGSAPSAIAPFTGSQLEEIKRLLEAIKSLS